MGNAAAIESVVESSRRRLLLQQHNRGSNDLVSQSLLKALEHRHRKYQRQQSQGNQKMLQSFPIHEIYEVLRGDFEVQCTVEEIPKVLRHLGCRLVDSPTGTDEEWYFVQDLLAFIAPRRVLRLVKRPVECPNSLEYSHNNVTIWQAAKTGDVEVLHAVCDVYGDAYRALDAFDNSPLYYASLCGRELVADFVLKAYERERRTIAADELLRCVTNALNQNLRALLQGKMTLEEVLKAKQYDFKDDEDEDSAGAWFGILDDEY